MQSLITLALASLVTVLLNLGYFGAEGQKPPCTDNTDCYFGEYCFQGRCDECRPCPSPNPDETIDGEVPKCRSDYENEGIGQCPNFCARTRIPVTPDDSICDPVYTLSCQEMATTTSGNSSTANAVWPEPSLTPSKEGSRISPVSNEYHKGDLFPIGTTGLVYVATDSSGKHLANCTVNITVNDFQSPEIACPSDIIVYTSDAQPRCVNLTVPQATDNSGHCTVKPINIEEDQTFKVGTTPVIYQATDPSDNRKNCSFNIINKDINIQCPEIENSTWPGPVITGADRNVDHSCSQQPGYRFASGNATVECSLYANGELITNRSCPVIISDAIHGESGRSIPDFVIVIIVMVILTVIVVIVVRHLWYRYKHNPEKQINSLSVRVPPPPNPKDQQSNETKGLSNAGYREIDETRPEPEIQDVPSTPNGSIPHSPNYSILNSPNGYSSLSSTQDSGSMELTGNSLISTCEDNQHQRGSRSSESNNPLTEYNRCDQTIKDLLNHPDTVQELCILLDPYESLLKSLGASYGLDYHRHKFIIYYKEPQTYPVFERILTFIKDTAKPEEDTGRQKIFRLLKELYDRHNGKAPIGEAIQNILGVHQSCPVCQQFANIRP